MPIDSAHYTSDQDGVSITRCAEALKRRLTASHAVVVSQDPEVLSIALDYLSIGIVSPPAEVATLQQAVLGSAVDRLSVLRVLAEVRDATRFRSFIGEWIRGKLLLDEPTAHTSISEDDSGLLFQAVRGTGVEESRVDESEENPNWRRRMRELIGNTFRFRPGRSFSGTPGVVNYVNKDESPE